MTITGEYSATVECGSKSSSIAFGAFAGKSKPHVRYDISIFLGEQGGSVLRMISTTSGMAAGLIGMNRERKLFAQWRSMLNAALPH
ncbi:hypothetical protein GCM10010401_11820 [Rarobacter faecitabidus]|uniref:Uncharacterized protein n=1 Tax=Rarobacter faecitabidus TaxID=13243 RepID=A0A542ZPE1_RARFA|nr:hypothetical protein [Rarobacter faecitabidus]TQL62080.1 hypothetical protein FB461_1715 [Rarobacter faecitabidus]